MTLPLVVGGFLALAALGTWGVLAHGVYQAHAEDARKARRDDLDKYLGTRPLPGQVVTDARALFELLCDREVPPGNALTLVEEVVGKKTGRTGKILAFVKDATETGAALEAAVWAKIDEK
jgi:hypothetical protein